MNQRRTGLVATWMEKRDLMAGVNQTRKEAKYNLGAKASHSRYESREYEEVHKARVVPRPQSSLVYGLFLYTRNLLCIREKSYRNRKISKKFIFYLTDVHLFDIFLLTVNEKGGVIAFICIKVISFISKIKECQKIFYPSNN